MATLNIPEDELPVVLQIRDLLRDLSDDAFADLIATIDRSPSSVPAIRGVSSEDARGIMSTLRSLYGVREYVEAPVEEFVSDLCETLREHKELSDMDAPRIGARFVRLFRIKPLEVVAKAMTLNFEHDRRFCTGRIITDARPVFGEDVTESPQAIIIYHMLKLSYHQTGVEDVRDIYIALRPRDLEELRGLIDRAEAKEKSLRTALEATKARVI